MSGSEELVLFPDVVYLGMTSIEAPKSETVIQAKIKHLASLSKLDNNVDKEQKVMDSNDDNVVSSDLMENKDCHSQDYQIKMCTMCVPNDCNGNVVVRLEDMHKDVVEHEGMEEENALVFPVCRIVFFARGGDDDDDFSFAFTTVKEDSKRNNKKAFDVHAFVCRDQEAMDKIFCSFAKAFKRPAAPVSGSTDVVLIEANLELREDGKSGFETVPRQKGVLKLRCNYDKRISLSLRQMSGEPLLNIVQCTEMTVIPGRFNCKGDYFSDEEFEKTKSDAQGLTDLTINAMFDTDHGTPSEVDDSCTHSGGYGRTTVISGLWKPTESILNHETPQDITAVHMSVCVSLLVAELVHPLRLVMSTQTRVYPNTEKYWYYTKKCLTRHFQLKLKKNDKMEGDDKNNMESGRSDKNAKEVKEEINKESNHRETGKKYDLLSVDTSEEMERVVSSALSTKLNLSSHLANLTASTLGSLGYSRNNSNIMGEVDAIDMPNNDESSGDEEAMLSGFGEVSKECSAPELEQWASLLQQWDTSQPLSYPKNLEPLIRNGVPEALRGEVWQRVTGASANMEEIIETYRVLMTKDSLDEKVIMRDIHRTFPAHEFFRDAGGNGQEALFRIAKAYSVYDAEIGYCQGQSFLIAALLLQMPEEQAFGVLVKVMHRLGLRDMFRENFEKLQLRLYQLEKLIESNMPDLANHFSEQGLEAHMYASQWFLTVFTAKFPLYLVFRVLDVFLYAGFDTVFQVALAILAVSKKELLTCDFESLMKYFRVNVPKRYRSEDQSRHLMRVASSIRLRKMKKYEKEWNVRKEAEKAREDPIVRLERENKRLLGDNLRLDTENDNLARELVTGRIEMRKTIDLLEDNKESADKLNSSLTRQLQEITEDKKRLVEETEQLKALLKREVTKLDNELLTRNNVIAEYKATCNRLQAQVEELQSSGHVPGVKRQEDGKAELESRVRDLELELAQTKLVLVETECKNQDLMHQISSIEQSSGSKQQGLMSGGVTPSTGWFGKTFNSIKEGRASETGVRKSASVDTTLNTSSIVASNNGQQTNLKH